MLFYLSEKSDRKKSVEQSEKRYFFSLLMNSAEGSTEPNASNMSVERNSCNVVTVNCPFPGFHKFQRCCFAALVSSVSSHINNNLKTYIAHSS